ncbi:MAG: hypothetical protein KKG04_02775, partial [Candidatus Thermoplasmatota archaeon]|nr:hypothetical protein [Candidatus Thermoplasmatota archaeon]
MCDFISWVEIKRKGKLVLCYLTDEDVFSKYGREIFVDSRDNDVLGHGAIRKYFKLGCEGLDKEVRDFWNNEKLPPELLEKTSSPNMFDKHWGRMWREKFFQNDDLTYLVKYAPEEWKVRAWEQLIKQNPSNDDLKYLVAYAPEEWKVRACEQLIKQNPSNDYLKNLVAYAPEEWKVRAWEQLLKQNPSNNDLIYLVAYAPEEWKVRACEQLLKQNPSNDDL